MSETDLQSGNTPAPPAKPGRKPRSKRWLILKVFGGLVLVLLVLILAAPTLLSTGPGLSIVLAQVNHRLNGKVEIQSLSLGWFTGVQLVGLRVKNAEGTQIAELDHLTVPFPLWRVITGKFPLGQVPVDGLSFDARTDSQGRLNFASLIKPSESSDSSGSAGTKSSVSKPLQISGDIKLTHCRGSYTQFGQPTVFLRQLDAEVKIPQTATPMDDASISISALSAAVQDDNVVKLTVTHGRLADLLSKRSVQLQGTIDYDLAAVWPIVQPKLGDQYKTLKISGKFSKPFNISGSYPADKSFTEAIKSLHADGDLAVAAFDYDGLNLQTLVVPFSLDNGKVVTVYAGKPTGQNTAAPAIANGGTMDLGNLTIDLTQDPPRLTTPANKVVITKLTINPLFANTFMVRFLNNPVFAGSGGSGFFDLTIVDCVDLPLGGILMEAVPANTGKVDAKFSLAPLVIGVDGIGGLNELLNNLLKTKMFNFNVRNGTIVMTANVQDGTVSVAKGISTEHLSFAVGKQGVDVDATVRLSDDALLPMNLSLVIGGARRFTLPVEGTLEHRSIPADKAANAIKDALEQNLLHGGSNPLDGLLKKLDKKKN